MGSDGQLGSLEERGTGRSPRLTRRERPVLPQIVAGSRTRERTAQRGSCRRTADVCSSHGRTKLRAQPAGESISGAVPDGLLDKETGSHSTSSSL